LLGQVYRLISTQGLSLTLFFWFFIFLFPLKKFCFFFQSLNLYVVFGYRSYKGYVG
jgi:hypothetical protein